MNALFAAPPSCLREGALSEDFSAYLAGFRAGSMLAGYRLEDKVREALAAP